MTSAAHNTLSGRSKPPQLRTLFNPKTIISLVLIGIFSFAALLALSGYAGDLRKDNSGKANAQSRSAIGYAGYVQLLKEMNYDVNLPSNLVTTKYSWETPALRIYTLTSPYQSETVKKIPDDEAQLIIMPKWSPRKQRGKPGWVEKPPYGGQTYTATRLSRLLKNFDEDLKIDQAESGPDSPNYTLKFSPLNNFVPKNDSSNHSELNTDNADADDRDDTILNYDIYTIDSAIDRLQSFDILDTSKSELIVLTADRKPILIRLTGTQTYILSEPDILNTHGIATEWRARFAVNLLDIIIEHEGLEALAADFDLSIHGLGGKRNIIKLLTLPPFLAATLCLLAAGGIITWQAFSRFGEAQLTEPDFAQGPVSLAKSAAEFMSVSGRVQHMAPDYTQLMRQQLIRKMGLVGQSQDYIDRWIKTRERQREITPSFEQLMAATAKNNTTNLIEHARAMTRWKEEMML